MAFELICRGCRQPKLFENREEFPVCPECEAWDGARVAKLQCAPPVESMDEDYRKPFSAKTKSAVWEKTDGLCGYCGVMLHPFGHRPNSFTVDHLIPKCFGGGEDLDNLVPACRKCNTLKGTRYIDEFRVRVYGTPIMRPGSMFLFEILSVSIEVMDEINESQPTL